MTIHAEKNSLNKQSSDEAKILSAKELGKKVRALRKKNTSLNQEEVSELIGTVQSAMSEIETGKYSPITLDLISRIAAVINANPHELAAAYWGTDLKDLNVRDKNTLDKFLSVAIEHLNSQNSSHLTPGQEKEARHLRDFEIHDPIADATPDVKPPLVPGQEPINQNPI